MGQVIKENLGFDFISVTNLGRNFSEAINTIEKTGMPLEVTSRSSEEGVLLTKELFLRIEENMKKLSEQNDELFEALAVQRLLSNRPGDPMIMFSKDSPLLKEIEEATDIKKNIFADVSDEELFNSWVLER